jgi:DNA adenine methylase
MTNSEMPVFRDILPPFLKWAGGKRWLVNSHSYLFPRSFDRYIEPFLGSAAVFFYLNPEAAILSDTNQSLVNCYQAIQGDWKRVQLYLGDFARAHSDKFYYLMRSRRFRSVYREAAKFIYLNRTCFNGIYRENLRGEFNVPRGSKLRVILREDNFGEVANRLTNVEIIANDFEAVLSTAGKDDFVFIDPPYTVKHNFNGFVKYNQRIFSWGDQVRLRDEVIKAATRGARCLVTNADHESIHELYRGVGAIFRLKRNSIIGASADTRGACTEAAVVIGYSALDHEGKDDGQLPDAVSSMPCVHKALRMQISAGARLKQSTLPLPPSPFD